VFLCTLTDMRFSIWVDRLSYDPRKPDRGS
jgi:hypothetical protein